MTRHTAMFVSAVQNGRKVSTGHSTSQYQAGNAFFLNPRTGKPNLNAQRPNWTVATSLSKPSVRRSALLGFCYDASFSSTTNAVNMSPSGSALLAVTRFSWNLEVHGLSQLPSRNNMCQQWRTIYPDCAKLCVMKVPYSCKDDVFRLSTTGRYRVARLYLDKQYISFKLSELHYLLNMFHAVQNQQTMYILALPDITK